MHSWELHGWKQTSKKPNVLLYQLDYQLQISHEDPAEKEEDRDMTGSQCRYSVVMPGLRIQESTSSIMRKPCPKIDAACLGPMEEGCWDHLVITSHMTMWCRESDPPLSTHSLTG